MKKYIQRIKVLLRNLINLFEIFKDVHNLCNKVMQICEK